MIQHPDPNQNPHQDHKTCMLWPPEVQRRPESGGARLKVPFRRAIPAASAPNQLQARILLARPMDPRRLRRSP